MDRPVSINKFRGFHPIFRSIQDHWLWQDKPFSKGQAWIDMLLLANYKENKVLINSNLIMVKQGEFITSKVKLAKRWGWTGLTPSYVPIIS